MYLILLFYNTIPISGGGRCKKLGGGGLSIATGEYTGESTVREVHSEHAKHALPLGGSEGMPPQEIFEKEVL